MNRYAHRLVDNDAAALNVLPDLTIPAVFEATGTDDRAVTVDEGARSRARSRSAKRGGPHASRRDEGMKNSQPVADEGQRHKHLEEAALRDSVRGDATTCESEAEGFEPQGHSISHGLAIGYNCRFRFLEKPLENAPTRGADSPSRKHAAVFVDRPPCQSRLWPILTGIAFLTSFPPASIRPEAIAFPIA